MQLLKKIGADNYHNKIIFSNLFFLKFKGLDLFEILLPRRKSLV
jgi:hypothetical protein